MTRLTVEKRLSRLEELIHGEEVAPIENFITVLPSGQALSNLGGFVVWRGYWDREAGYRINDMVRYRGKAYICIKPVAEKNLVTGPGPAPGSLGKNDIFFPDGRSKPIGRIASGEENAGKLSPFPTPEQPGEENEDGELEPTIPARPASARMEQYNRTMQQGWRADIWELWLKESEVNAELTLEKFPVSGPAGETRSVIGSYRPYFANENGVKDISERAFSVFPGGKNTINALGGTMPEAYKEGGAVRFYVVLFGGQYQYQEPFGPIVRGQTLPLPYVFVVNGAAIVAPPGNLPPPEDALSWEAIDSAAEGGGVVVHPTSVYGTVTLPHEGPGGLKKVVVETVEEDANGWWDATNKRYNPKTAGWYALHASYVDTVAALPSGGVVDIGVHKNGEPISNYAASTMRIESSNSSYGVQSVGTWYAHADGEADYFEVYGNSSDAGRKGRVKMVAYPLG